MDSEHTLLTSKEVDRIVWLKANRRRLNGLLKTPNSLSVRGTVNGFESSYTSHFMKSAMKELLKREISQIEDELLKMGVDPRN